ncbi:MAG: hypothetical protein L3K00_02815 [Thermoplasmata archaeon]|nr:hypothetical protein [Thermoplasmata archaeon]MCI4361864.1 hypothetical protein [Thermoplasmata archaeon]
MSLPPPDRSREIPWLVFAVLFLTVTGVLWFTALGRTGEQPIPRSQVASIEWTFSACWAPITTTGPGPVSSATPFHASVTLPPAGSASCEVENLSLQPTVFLLDASDAPFSVGTGSSAVLEIVVGYEPNLPGILGPLAVSVNVSASA